MAGTSAGAAKRYRCPSCGAFGPHDECPKVGPKPRPLLDRLWAKVDIRGDDECWEWNGTHQPGGYGVIDKQSVTRILMKVPKGDKRVVRHTCDNPPCCNPAHLLVGTQQDNADDMVSRKRSNAGQRHWNSTLTPEQIACIRLDERPSAAIAEDYGVSSRHIRKIKSGDKWRTGFR